MNDNKSAQSIALNWRWLVVTYCLLILFHLLPSFMLLGEQLGMRNLFVRFNERAWPAAIWLAVGIVAVTAFIGRRSEAKTVLSGGLASASYAFTIIVVTSSMGMLPSTLHRIIIITLWFVLILLACFAVGCAGSAFGARLRKRSERHLETAQTANKAL